MKIDVFVVNGFTHNGQGGNPAGVVLDAAGLRDENMQHIATAMGLSETAFVLPADQQDYQVRFFTPTSEVDFCGHATVATYSLLWRKRLLKKPTVSQLTKAGVLAVQVDDNGLVRMNQALPRFGQMLDVASLAAVLGLEVSDIADTGLPVQILSTGLADIMVPVVSEAALASIHPDLPVMAALNRQTGSIGVHAFTLDSADPTISAHCRNFAPLVGIDEETATGSSCGALACYLSHHLAGPADRFGGEYLFEQGKAMGNPSRLSALVSMADDQITGIVVGGYGGDARTVEVSL